MNEKIFALLLRALPYVLSFVGSLLLAPCSPSEAQQGKIPRIGMLISGTSSGATRNIRAFQQRLGELGYVDGKNIIIEQRYAEGNVQIVPDLADELIRLKPDVIVTDTSRATQVAKNATKTIPVVFTAANDPVGDAGGDETWWEPHRVFPPRPRVKLEAARAPQGRVSQDHADRVSHETRPDSRGRFHH